MPAGTGVPTVELTSIPAYGTFANLHGRVYGVDRGTHHVAVYIRVGGWWTKPYWSSPATSIRADGSFECDVTTGGIDELATGFAAFVLPRSFTIPLMSGGSPLPQELYANALAHTTADRPRTSSRSAMLAAMRPILDEEGLAAEVRTLGAIVWDPRHQEGRATVAAAVPSGTGALVFASESGIEDLGAFAAGNLELELRSDARVHVGQVTLDDSGAPVLALVDPAELGLARLDGTWERIELPLALLQGARGGAWPERTLAAFVLVLSPGLGDAAGAEAMVRGVRLVR